MREIHEIETVFALSFPVLFELLVLDGSQVNLSVSLQYYIAISLISNIEELLSALLHTCLVSHVAYHVPQLKVFKPRWPVRIPYLSLENFQQLFFATSENDSFSGSSHSYVKTSVLGSYPRPAKFLIAASFNQGSAYAIKSWL